MIPLATNSHISVKYAQCISSLSKTPVLQHKLLLSQLFKAHVPYRTLKTCNTSQSVQPCETTAYKAIPDIHGNKVDLEKLGNSRPKIEVDGMMLNWDMAGSGDQVLLLLPGVLGTIQTDFGCLFQKMDKIKYTLVSWDPPGYGRSRPPNRDFATGIYYRRDGHKVVKLMDKLGIDKFSVLGWSNGGTSALHIAADYPTRVEKIVTWCASAYADEHNLNLARSMCKLDLWSPKMLEPLLAIYGKEYILKTMQDWYKSVSDFRKDNKLNYTLIERLPYIKCPALLIHGEEDTAIKAKHAEFLNDHIKNSQMTVLPKGGHNLHLRYTDEFLKIVTRFLDS